MKMTDKQIKEFIKNLTKEDIEKAFLSERERFKNMSVTEGMECLKKVLDIGRENKNEITPETE